mmetsp:Transcript_69434/g.194180  ORF Transcript_69434/g.194180 Transcript_69434/m.194180 type:complete len:215 (-) Transcript_69434:215-859(-)
MAKSFTMSSLVVMHAIVTERSTTGWMISRIARSTAMATTALSCGLATKSGRCMFTVTYAPRLGITVCSGATPAAPAAAPTPVLALSSAWFCSSSRARSVSSNEARRESTGASACTARLSIVALRAGVTTGAVRSTAPPLSRVAEELSPDVEPRNLPVMPWLRAVASTIGSTSDQPIPLTSRSRPLPPRSGPATMCHLLRLEPPTSSRSMPPMLE